MGSRRRFTDVYERGASRLWSKYATDLYLRLRRKAETEGWSSKLRYLLYEDLITEQDAPRFAELDGVLLQSKPAENGRSRNRDVAKLQSALPG